MSEEKMQPQPQPPAPPDPSLRDFALGQVKQSLRPLNPDPVEAREALLAVLHLGFDPSDLYLQAVAVRPPEWDPAPPLAKVLPQELLEHLQEREDQPLSPEEESASPPPPPQP